MSVNTIAYQGEPGANSHIACDNVYPGWKTLSCPTFEDALAAIAEGTALLGMIPDREFDRRACRRRPSSVAGSGLHIIAEYFLPIHFQLLGVRGAKLEDVGPFSAMRMPSASAASSSARMGLPPMWQAIPRAPRGRFRNGSTRAAPPSPRRLAANIYSLDVLPRISRTRPHNTTRFVVLSKNPQWPPPACGPVVTSFVFRVRNLPAALYKALGGFATNGVNMTKLESYMVEGEFTATQFLADVEAHPEDLGLSRALEELAFFCKEWKILGVYPAHPFRIESQKRERPSF